MNAITQNLTHTNPQKATNVSPLDAQAIAQNDSSLVPRRCETLAVVEALKEAGQDFEFYPSTEQQISQVTADMVALLKTHEFSKGYHGRLKLLDIGAGDGRVLQMMKAVLEAQEHEKLQCDLYAIEKASIQTATYRKKDITLLGTEFNEVNFISKNVDVAFVNSPYSDFSHWMVTLISQLNFKLLYAIMPKRWQGDEGIMKAIERRSIKSVKVIAQSDYFDAHRQARAEVEIVRFVFDDFDVVRKSRHDYKPTIGRNATDPFQIFLEDELGLKQTYSKTTNQFYAHVERKRISEAMQTEGSASFEVVASKGVLWALLENYERDLFHVLTEYKKIGALDSAILQELGIDHKGLCEGVKEKLLGYRHVYWSLLFDELDEISTRLTGKNKTQLLDTLAANALDFTHKNAVYVISFAVEMANELIESSLIEVYTDLTSEKSISRHYKSNEHIYQDRYRHNHESPNQHARYLLDYRFISSHHSNFERSYWSSSTRGLCGNARGFCDDLVVVMRLLGYREFNYSVAYDDICAGDKLIIRGEGREGKEEDLLHIRFYQNGNRHIQFNQEVMLRFNCTVSRLLGWVRSKAEFETEAQTKTVSDAVWCSGEKMKLQPSSVLALTAPVSA